MKKRWKWLSKHEKRYYDKSISVRYGNDEFWIYTEPIKDMNNTNIKYDCPIIYGGR